MPSPADRGNHDTDARAAGDPPARREEGARLAGHTRGHWPLATMLAAPPASRTAPRHGAPLTARARAGTKAAADAVGAGPLRVPGCFAYTGRAAAVTTAGRERWGRPGGERSRSGCPRPPRAAEAVTRARAVVA
ncbi:hypothetical protein [Streptomyces eurythermus]